MPSPFPGMDPYLEGSEWTSVYTVLAVEIARQLTPRLLPRYIARTEKRSVVASFDATDDIGIASTYPDASVAKVIQPNVAARSGTTVIAAPLTIATIVPERIPHVSVEIRDTAQRQLVTAIQILSPTNKRGTGRAEYLERRQRLLLSAAHLVEIDLLRHGQRLPMQQHLPSVPYFVFVGRAERPPLTEIWPITLREPLPVVPIPLLPGDADVSLDLQEALTAVYDGCAYAASIDYTRPPEIPLAGEDAEWAMQRLADRLEP
jgi:hypothetical protein